SAKTLGAATTITFASGVATTSGNNNGKVTLFRAETATISASSTGVSTLTAATVTVAAGTGARLAWTSSSNSSGSLNGVCYFTCTYIGVGGSGTTFISKVS